MVFGRASVPLLWDVEGRCQSYEVAIEVCNDGTVSLLKELDVRPSCEFGEVDCTVEIWRENQGVLSGM